MNLQRMNDDRYAAYFICLDCGKRLVLSRAEPPIYADLDGEPFKAYYCPDCAETLAQKAGFFDWKAAR
jgi:uncharacterized protein YlaI